MNRMKKAAAALAALVLVTVLASCDSALRYSEFRSLPDEGWPSRHALTFTADSLGVDGPCVMHLVLRSPTARPYPFTELYLERVLLVDSTRSVDTLRLPLTGVTGDDDADGLALRRYIFPVDTLRLSPDTRLTVRLRHIMRRDPVDSFSDIGVSITKI